MDSKQANEIIATEKSARKIKRLVELQAARHYRIYRVTPITSLFHHLPFVDICDETEGREARVYLCLNCGCSWEEIYDAVATADAGGMGVCITSRWTTYLVERLK